jgi:uncharacterized protein YqhQ
MHTKTIGGQAVIEGVMMKSPEGWSVAVRDPKGVINFKTVRTTKNHPFLRLPLIRGSVALLQALIIGVKAIEFSGNVAFQDDGEKPLSPWSIALSIGMAIVLAIALFKFLPLAIATLFGSMYESVGTSSLFFNTIDGVVRVFIFFIYIFAIGLWGEMRRIYEYHGAEHKVIYAFEAQEELTVQNARKYKPFHPRCGTSFLLIVMFISIAVFMFIPQSWTFVEKLLARVVMVPLIAGVAYEAQRATARLKDHPVMGFVVWPGMMLQRLTVREPDDAQIEVAIAALQDVLKLEKTEQESCTQC